jgi:hypothetical protein
MARKRRRLGRVNAKGRNIGDGHHALLYRWMHRSPAFQHLTVGARALLLELKMLYTGQNNGELFLSVREAAKRLNIGKTHAAKCFRELVVHGFIRPKTLGAYNLKSAARRGEATTWIMTEHPIGEAVGVGSRDFMTWQPAPDVVAKAAAENIRRSAWRAKCPRGGTVRPKVIESVREEGHLAAFSGARRSATGHTDNIPWGRT